MIIFGHNNFLIKAFTPEEVRLPVQEGDQQVSFEVRQRYAHIFWIPFFPIGKLWCIRVPGSKDLYQMPEEVKAAILQNYQGEIKTPWYSYSLILIAMAVGLFMYLGELQKKQEREDAFYNRVEEKKMLIDYPTTGDYYVFQRYEDPDRWESDKFVLKVNQYDESTTSFISLYPYLYQKMSSNDSYDFYKAFDAVETQAFNEMNISRDAIKAAIEQEYRETFKPVKIPPLEGYYKLELIKRRELDK
ncbi:hypothetical protein V6R21_24070 [Limibacter armeniacum]|uniref:hypothetical protein n=1 Tax=Limibacter armeniacum TaxID=466084 RepID=UPI002FE66F2F